MMNDRDKKDIAKYLAEEINQHEYCAVFDRQTIEGIKAIASLYQQGKKTVSGVFWTIIFIGLITVGVIGIAQWIKNFFR
jgi:hypothetical protein